MLRDFTLFLICKFCAAKVSHSWSVQAYKLRSEAGLPHRFVWCQGATEIEFYSFTKWGILLNLGVLYCFAMRQDVCEEVEKYNFEITSSSSSQSLEA